MEHDCSVSVVLNRNSPHTLGDHAPPSYEMTPGFKPFTIIIWLLTSHWKYMMLSNVTEVIIQFTQGGKMGSRISSTFIHFCCVCWDWLKINLESWSHEYTCSLRIQLSPPIFDTREAKCSPRNAPSGKDWVLSCIYRLLNEMKLGKSIRHNWKHDACCSPKWNVN